MQRQLVGVIENRARQLRKQAPFLDGREPPPDAVARVPRGAHGAVDVLGRAERDRRKRLAVRWIDHRQRRAGHGRDPAIADEMFGGVVTAGIGCGAFIDRADARRARYMLPCVAPGLNFHASVYSSVRGT